jgi:hypothetical protein
MSSSPDGDKGNPGIPARRRRSFLASKQSEFLEADTLPTPPQPLPDALEDASKGTDEDDIPVLTEVVTGDPATPPQQPHPSEPPSEAPKPDLAASVDARLEELAAQMAEAIGRQMAYELPTLIEATLLNASEDLRTGITATMEAALRDFNARRKQLQLPLDAPDEDDTRR